jgi:glycosyltransferase involved in cell wall biosynthesis
MDILFVCYRSPGGDIVKHPAHERYVSQYDYDEIYIEKNWVPFKLFYESYFSNISPNIDYNGNKDSDYDIVLIEAPLGLHKADSLSSIYSDSNIVYLNSNWMLWPEMSHDFYGDYTSLKNMAFTFERYLNKRSLINNLREYIDYIISVSDFCDNEINKLCEISSFVVEPHISPERYNRLAELSPKLDSKDVLFIGENRNHKGIDILIDSWTDIIDNHPEAKLRLVGKGHPDRLNKIKGVKTMGYVSEEELFNIIEESSLYLHPARFENFGISVLESMQAGVPSIVSNHTGVKDIVREVDSSLVTQVKKNNIVQAVDNYFKENPRTIKQYSKRSKELTDKYNQERSQYKMSNVLEKIVSDV